MVPDVLVAVQGNTDVAAARRAAVQMASDAGLPRDDVGALGVVVTEAATNIIKHGGGGEIILRDYAGCLAFGNGPVGAATVEVIAIDRGKGISNIVRSFQDGYSTAGSPGTGLGAISRLASFYEIFSLEGSGTVLIARIGRDSAKRCPFEVGVLSVPYPGETVCGDAWVFRIAAGRGRLLIADGLGHGVHASDASRMAVDVVAGSFTEELPGTPLEVLENANRKLKSTRGAAVAVMDIDYTHESLEFTGVGNIVCAIVDDPDHRRQTVSMNGIVGEDISKPRQYRYPLKPESLVIVHSDGLSTNWSLSKYPGLIARDTTTIAAVLFRDFRRIRDDATVVVVRQVQEL